MVEIITYSYAYLYLEYTFVTVMKWKIIYITHVNMTANSAQAKKVS